MNYFYNLDEVPQIMDWDDGAAYSMYYPPHYAYASYNQPYSYSAQFSPYSPEDFVTNCAPMGTRPCWPRPGFPVCWPNRLCPPRRPVCWPFRR